MNGFCFPRREAKTLKALLGLALLGLAAAQPAQSPPGAADYAVGQVWEYRTRPGEEGSLLRIQRIEPWAGAEASDGRVYHISIIGIRFQGSSASTALPHMPVSRRTLDLSVTRLSRSTAGFPEPDEGIALWREARGGIFEEPLARVLDIADEVLRGAPETRDEAPVV